MVSFWEEHHGHEEQESIPDDRNVAGAQSVRGKACKASHSRTRQHPTGLNASQEEGAQRWEMSDGSGLSAQAKNTDAASERPVTNAS